MLLEIEVSWSAPPMESYAHGFDFERRLREELEAVVCSKVVHWLHHGYSQTYSQVLIGDRRFTITYYHPWRVIEDVTVNPTIVNAMRGNDSDSRRIYFCDFVERDGSLFMIHPESGNLLTEDEAIQQGYPLASFDNDTD